MVVTALPYIPPMCRNDFQATPFLHNSDMSNTTGYEQHAQLTLYTAVLSGCADS